MKHSKTFPRFYVLVGEKINWEVSLNTNIWGFIERSKGLWNTIEINEFIAFYVTKPIQKIIGFGRITEKFIDNEILWSDEKLFKRVIWKYRINFKIIHLINDWNEGIVVPTNFMRRSSRTVVDNDLFFDFVKKADEKWKTNILKEIKKDIKKLKPIKQL